MEPGAHPHPGTRRGRQGAPRARRAALQRLCAVPPRAAGRSRAAPGRARRAGHGGSGAADRLAPSVRRLLAPGRHAVRHRDPRGRTPRRTRARCPVRPRHHLRTGDPEAPDVECRRLLPSATATARLGADLTAVVTGTPSTRLAALLDSVADRETSGTASVWRFSAAGARRALDAGHTPEDIAADLAAVAAGPLPQPLSYLIADTARGHGRVRIAPAACVLHGDEPALLAELAAHRKLAKLGLRRLAPTVLISRSPLDATLAALRAEGYAPVAETDEGTVRIEKTRPRRAAAAVPAPRGSRARGAGRTAAPSPAKGSADFDPSALATRLLAAPATIPDPAPFEGGAPFATDTEEIVAGWAKQLPYTDVRQLAHAIDTGQAITVEYIAASGNLTVRTLSRLELAPPHLEAWCHPREDERVFTLSRIYGVMPT
ncbi:helicase-associated domain-containing protein [Streptomyces sp. CS081A]|uniref:helicase-associated domain-containing protein n=1 Tax=Streptomyces sp. CS081A TaxID=2162709 RepID=UPI001EF72B2E|nr:helicase-associated domain-containing protein [Streptomyces sp. CS081A]